MAAAKTPAARRTVAAKTPAAKTAAKTPAGVVNTTARKRVMADPDTARPMGPNSLHEPEPVVGIMQKMTDADWANEEQVEVFVKKAFKFTTDDHVVHDIHEGTQTVPREWFEHSYFKDHGVRETEQRK